MKKTLVLLVALGLIAGSFAAPATAKKKKKKKPARVERVVEVKYEAPAIGASPPGTGVCFRPTNSCGDIAVGADERFISVEITDLTGTPVSFNLGQDTDPDTLGTESSLGTFCGTTGDELIAIEPGFTVIVFPWAIGADCASVGTQGTVTATLTNLP
jgi:hypothetical protein